MANVHVVLHHWEFEGAEAVTVFPDQYKEEAEEYAKQLTAAGSRSEWWDVTTLPLEYANRPKL